MTISWVSSGIFSASSYGKSPCYNIGGTVTRLVTQSSFQNNHVLNADLIYGWCVDNIPAIIVIQINTDDVQTHTTKFSLEERYSSDDSFQGWRIYHRLIPTANGFVMRITSAGKGASNVSISKIRAPSNITDLMPRMYVAWIYDDDWFVGNVICYICYI